MRTTDDKYIVDVNPALLKDSPGRQLQPRAAKASLHRKEPFRQCWTCFPQLLSCTCMNTVILWDYGSQKWLIRACTKTQGNEHYATVQTQYFGTVTVASIYLMCISLQVFTRISSAVRELCWAQLWNLKLTSVKFVRNKKQTWANKRLSQTSFSFYRKMLHDLVQTPSYMDHQFEDVIVHRRPFL